MAYQSIDWYLRHTVSIVTVTYSKGSRTTSTATDIPAFIAGRKRVIREAYGDQEMTDLIIWLKPTQTITEQDEVVVDGITRPVKEIKLGRNFAGVVFKRVILG